MRENPRYNDIALLSLVVTSIGSIHSITPAIIEQLFTADMLYLKSVYEQINGLETEIEVQCPYCGKTFLHNVNVC